MKCEQPVACACSFPSFVTHLAGWHGDQRHPPRPRSGLPAKGSAQRNHQGMTGSLLGRLSVDFTLRAWTHLLIAEPRAQRTKMPGRPPWVPHPQENTSAMPPCPGPGRGLGGHTH